LSGPAGESRVLRIKSHGTGSKPPGLKGWHLEIRFTARKQPLTGPYFSMAEIAYTEHVG